MSVAESLVLGILAILCVGNFAERSIRSELARTIGTTAAVGAYWMLVIIAGDEFVHWFVAAIF